jgi:hypothetical protein
MYIKNLRISKIKMGLFMATGDPLPVGALVARRLNRSPDEPGLPQNVHELIYAKLVTPFSLITDV